MKIGEMSGRYYLIDVGKKRGGSGSERGRRLAVKRSERPKSTKKHLRKEEAKRESKKNEREKKKGS